ncbi:hypothetical protein EVAR_58806_1 [Eumeta japonica]|uniref:Uncharacterized protein n=1 Tax=Eumeta variegata TaxID=151549 RepID=A0A4C1YKT4_EUMVA|nr:hypothetical protein EVAR_58806_1 [Eumeta japonica]
MIVKAHNTAHTPPVVSASPKRDSTSLCGVEGEHALWTHVAEGTRGVGAIVKVIMCIAPQVSSNSFEKYVRAKRAPAGPQERPDYSRQKPGVVTPCISPLRLQHIQSTSPPTHPIQVLANVNIHIRPQRYLKANHKFTLVKSTTPAPAGWPCYVPGRSARRTRLRDSVV